jgi:hypothetical protein
MFKDNMDKVVRKLTDDVDDDDIGGADDDWWLSFIYFKRDKARKFLRLASPHDWWC